jgi:D-serine deaminase-like pyridoxal phosphate-dependent protein
MSALPRVLDDLETPAAVVDVDCMANNLRVVAEYCRAHSLAWRPHTKTHKTRELGATQMAAGAAGLTVATLREAEVMARVCNDLLIAYPPVGARKLERLLALPAHIRLTVALDSAEVLIPLARAAQAANRTVGVLIEIDAGMGRVGVGSPEAAVELARRASQSAGVEYRGILYYPGHLRQPAEEMEAGIAALRERMDGFVAALAGAGLPPTVVSGGSTPTFWFSHRVGGLTEVRPGTNIFNDRTSAAIGVCAWEDCAYSVLATVVSTAVEGQAVVDAGAKALAREELRGPGGGYGALLARPEVVVSSLSEEHGILDLSRTDWRPRVGDRVRIVPNHVCVSVNLQDALWAVRGAEIVDRWPVLARGRERFVPGDTTSSTR